MERITLYYRAGSSDKMYEASLQPKDGGYVVNFAYGRRGSTLTTGSKTSSPVDYQTAKGIYDKLIKEKTAKGYQPGENGTAYQNASTTSNNESTGINCQLLNPVDEDRAQDLIHDPEYWMQEKHDGRRLLIRKGGSSITGINRKGQAVALPASMIESAEEIEEDFIIDGEAIGDTLLAFDALSIGDDDIQGLRYGERFVRLRNLLGSFPHRHIRLVETFFRTQDKNEQFHTLKESGKEGVVFKHTDAPYIAGRPNSGGPQLKYKFHETASFIVTKVNAKRSVMLVLFSGDKIVHAGNVTIPPNHEVPSPGSVVECRYLYAFPESGCIYQPTYLGLRDDIRSADCTTDQLKFKPALVAA